MTPILCILVFGLTNPGSGPAEPPQEHTNPGDTAFTMAKTVETATFGAGCFWCVEAVFENVEGVDSVVSGYSGGRRPNPTYEQVTTGVSGHAEACQVRFDPAKVTYAEILEIFWRTHDPTTKDRQGNDVGTQYRSVIFYHDEEQRRIAEHYKKKLAEARVYEDPIVTEIVKFDAFYEAERYHQNYYAANPDQPYCRFVIQPKLEKFKKVFGDKLKKR